MPAGWVAVFCLAQGSLLSVQIQHRGVTRCAIARRTHDSRTGDCATLPLWIMITPARDHAGPGATGRQPEGLNGARRLGGADPESMVRAEGLTRTQRVQFPERGASVSGYPPH